jgi:predicted esterase
MNTLPLLIALTSLIPACTSTTSPVATPAISTKAVHIHPIYRDSIITYTIAAQESYCVYMPHTVIDVPHAAVVLFQDPHGDGQLPINKYKYLAARLGLILVGANQSRNGQLPDANVAHVEHILTGLYTGLGIPANHVTLAGFSGGAKSAMLAASRNPAISQVLYVGSMTSVDYDHPVQLNGLAGEGDMNYAALIAYHTELHTRHPQSTLIAYSGIHDWPSEATYIDLLYAAALHHIQIKTSTRNDTLISLFKHRIDSLIQLYQKNDKPIIAAQYADFAVQCLSGITDTQLYTRQLAQITASEKYVQAQHIQTVTIEGENKQNQMLTTALLERDLDWWRQTVTIYKRQTDLIGQRHIGFISLLCYSYSSQLLQTNRVDQAKDVLAVYEMVDPNNVDQLYFHSMYYAMKNEPKSCNEYLLRAVKSGWTDKAKIDAQPAFNTMRSNAEFAAILALIGQAK